MCSIAKHAFYSVGGQKKWKKNALEAHKNGYFCQPKSSNFV